MDFEVTEDQRALADGIDALCRGRLGLERLRKGEGAQVAIDEGAWAALGEAGVFSLTVPKVNGGLGLDLRHGAVVFERLGAHLVPGPLVATTLAARHLEGAAEGHRRIGWAQTPAPGASTPALIHHLAGLDGLLVVAGPGARRVHLVEDLAEVSAVSRRVERPLDPLTPLFVVEDPAVLEAGTAFSASQSAELLRGALVLTAAMGVGMAAQVTELATAYAKERQQFGRPVGSFQAVKHLCADMLVRTEVARCALYAAATLADQDEAAAEEAESAGTRPEQVRQRAAAGAKLLADQAAVTNARAAIQVYGGMGFTWEVPLHLYLKRAHVLATTVANHDTLAETVAALVEPAAR